MTDITLHVPDRETCKMLRDAGFPQETYMYWHDAGYYCDGFWKEEWTVMCEPYNKDSIAAPLVSETMTIIKNYIGVFFDDEEDMFACAWDMEDECEGIIDDSNKGEYFKCILNLNPATACALMWMRLRKEGKL